ncbi:hypothetical protein HDU76_005056 [Blyttiomyces sp. JEL0837]|nr:hypothetical protein HDU76_005056 [Blyttiomyces sp. JEL0837]
MNVGVRKRKGISADFDDIDIDDDDVENTMGPADAKDIDENSAPQGPKLAPSLSYTRPAVCDGKVANGLKLHEYIRYDTPNEGKQVVVFIRWIADMEMDYMVDGKTFTVFYTPMKVDVEGLFDEEMEAEEKRTGKMSEKKKALIQYFTTDPMDQEKFCYSFELPDNIDSKARDEEIISFPRLAWPADGGDKKVGIEVPVFRAFTFDVSSQKKRRHSLAQFSKPS